MAITAIVNGRDVFVCLVTGFGNRCVVEVYLGKLPVVFDILNGQHEHELGTFKFSPVFYSRLLRSLLALGRLLLHRFPRRFLRPAKCRPRETVLVFANQSFCS